jgi:hypothetical protein
MHNWPGCHVACPEQLSGAEASAGRAVPRAHPGSRHTHPLHPPGSLSDPHRCKYVTAGCRIRIGILNGDPNPRKLSIRKKLSFDDLDAPREGVLLMLVLEVCHGDLEIDKIIITVFFDQNKVHMPIFKIFVSKSKIGDPDQNGSLRYGTYLFEFMVPD